MGQVDEDSDAADEQLDLPDTLFEDELADGRPETGDEEEDEAPRRNALPRRVESWRTRSATGAVISAMAMGLRQVFMPEQEKPAIIAEAPGDPYDDEDPIVVDYVADDASGTTVILRPWLLPGAEPGGDDHAGGDSAGDGHHVDEEAQ